MKYDKRDIDEFGFNGFVPEPVPAFGFPCGPWHKVFAWLPVRTYDQRKVWFSTVNRRCIAKHSYLDGGDDFWWQYSLYDHAKPTP